MKMEVKMEGEKMVGRKKDKEKKEKMEKKREVGGGGGQMLTVLITAPSTEGALAVARALVHARLAACVQVLPGLTSVYRWNGKVCEEPEVLLLAKTAADGFPALERKILELHPYQVPQVVALPVVAAHGPYLAWVRAGVTPR